MGFAFTMNDVTNVRIVTRSAAETEAAPGRPFYDTDLIGTE
jgi:hypothetical protein